MEGDVDNGTVMAGQIAGMVKKEQTCKEMIEEMIPGGGAFGQKVESECNAMSKIAFIFPGQGAQTTGMGQDFYQETETGREMFEKASEILGFSMTDLCFDPAQTDRLNITEYTQPAMVTASLAMMRVFMERTESARMWLYLSLGEYPANGGCRRYV